MMPTCLASMTRQVRVVEFFRVLADSALLGFRRNTNVVLDVQVGWSVGRSVGREADRQAGRQAGRLVGRSVGRSVRRSVGR